MRIFVSYSHKDRAFSKQLETHLRPLAGDAGLDLWVDTRIRLGETWRDEIERALDAADVAILLISAEFLASEFISSVEIPAILRASRKRSLLIVPVYVGRVDLTGSALSEYQGPNGPDRPLALMERPKRDVIFADLVSRLRKLSGSNEEKQAPGLSGVTTEVIPASGRLFDRVGERGTLSRFLRDPKRRIFILRGLPGVGKSVLTAHVAEHAAAIFPSVCWIRCGAGQMPAEILFERLDSFLQKAGDKSLSGPRQLKVEDRRLNKLVEVAVMALSRQPYLIVLDDFGSQLGSAHQIQDTVISRLLETFASRGKASKVILVTDRRPASDGSDTRLPTGTVVEQEIAGLPTSAVRQLMNECGVRGVDPSTVERVTEQLSGNPTAIRMLCSLVTRRRVDVTDVLGPEYDRRAPFKMLLQHAVADLRSSIKSALGRLSLLRLPPDWDSVDAFGLDRDDLIPLLDRSLLVLDAASHSLIVPELVRRFVRDDMMPQDRANEHACLARSYESLVGDGDVRNLEDARRRLEAGYHQSAAGNGEAGARMSLRAADALITWGYASVCEEALALILADCPGTWAEPEAFYLRGRIADQRGRLTEALADFARAVEQTSDDRVRARCLFYIGRINSARGQLDAGERHLEESIALSRMPHVEIPTAAALLALAWIRKEKGADEAETLQAFRTALEEATRQRDLITAGDAHRQLGFFDWTTSKGREQARLHYSEALRLARRCRALPQVAAIFSEMGYLATEWGQPDRAIRYCMNALKIARVVGDEFVIPGVEVNLGLAQRKCGHGEAALASLRKAIQGFRNTENPGGEAYARYELGRALVESGDTGAAREQLEAAARLCRKHGLSAQLRSIESALTEI